MEPPPFSTEQLLALFDQTHAEHLSAEVLDRVVAGLVELYPEAPVTA